MMFPIIVTCGEQLQEYLNNTVEKEEEIDVKDALARFTTDVIASCAFGIETNSLENPDSEFWKHGKDYLKSSLFRVFLNLLFTFNSKLTNFLQVFYIYLFIYIKFNQFLNTSFTRKVFAKNLV